MTARFFFWSVAALALAAAVWWIYPQPLASVAVPAPALAATVSTPLAFPIAAASSGQDSVNNLFTSDRHGELIFTLRTEERLQALALSVPRDLTPTEVQAIDDFASAGLPEPAASQARRIVFARLERRGTATAMETETASPIANPIPEILPEALRAARPPPPPPHLDANGAQRFPGMGDD